MVEKISSKDFYRVAKEHEYFIWNFVSKDASPILSIQSYFLEREIHPLKEIIDLIKIPYFESEISEEVDFVINLEDGYAQKILTDKGKLKPLMIGFKRARVVASTFQGICYCQDGLIEIIAKLNPEFLLNTD